MRRILLILFLLAATCAAAMDPPPPRLDGVPACSASEFAQLKAKAESDGVVGVRPYVKQLYDCHAFVDDFYAYGRRGALMHDADTTNTFLRGLAERGELISGLGYAADLAERGNRQARYWFFMAVSGNKIESLYPAAEKWYVENLRIGDDEAYMMLGEWISYSLDHMSKTHYQDAAVALHFVDFYSRTDNPIRKQAMQKLRGKILEKAASVGIPSKVLETHALAY